jgi:hypothetical protein
MVKDWYRILYLLYFTKSSCLSITIYKPTLSCRRSISPKVQRHKCKWEKKSSYRCRQVFASRLNFFSNHRCMSRPHFVIASTMKPLAIAKNTPKRMVRYVSIIISLRRLTDCKCPSYPNSTDYRLNSRRRCGSKDILHHVLCADDLRTSLRHDLWEIYS